MNRSFIMLLALVLFLGAGFGGSFVGGVIYGQRLSAENAEEVICRPGWAPAGSSVPARDQVARAPAVVKGDRDGRDRMALPPGSVTTRQQEDRKVGRKGRPGLSLPHRGKAIRRVNRGQGQVATTRAILSTQRRPAAMAAPSTQPPTRSRPRRAEQGKPQRREAPAEAGQSVRCKGWMETC